MKIYLKIIEKNDMETTPEKNNITVNDVKENIRQFDFKSWVKHGVLFDRSIDTMLDGSEIYQRVFAPVLYDMTHEKRYNFYRNVGYNKLMNELRKKGMSQDELFQISIDIENVIRECLAPLWTGYFEYPTLIFPRTIMETHVVLDWRYKTRNDFRKELKKRNLSLEEVSDIIYESTGTRNFALVKDIFLENIASAVDRRKKHMHETRKDISRLAMRSGIPSDLVPTICAFAVPGSKLYSYM